GGACLGQERGEAAAHTQGGQVHAFLEELPARGLALCALVRVRPGHRDGAAVYDREPAGGCDVDGQVGVVPSLPRHSTSAKAVAWAGEPPLVKSLTSNRSPSLWMPTNAPVPLPLTFGLLVMWLRRNQKPAVALPLLSKRSKPPYRSRCPLLGSVYRAA